MDTKQPEALILAALNDAETWPGELSIVTFAARAAAELRRQHAEIETLRTSYDAARLEIASLQAQLEAVGAGGVGALMAAPVQGEPAQAGEYPEPSPTAGMSIAQRILHVGGRNNAAGYVEFGSTQAVEALVCQVLRDRAAAGVRAWLAS